MPNLDSVVLEFVSIFPYKSGGAPMNYELTHSDLYRASRGDSVELLGIECSKCGFVAFPRQRYGCERCGAAGDALHDVELSSDGTLASYATVHMHQAKTIAAPFVIGEIALDAGPTVRATMVEPDDAAMQIGARVSGRLHPAPAAADAAAQKLELRFSLTEAPA
jgi:uncharacterized OB-fold protein